MNSRQGPTVAAADFPTTPIPVIEGQLVIDDFPTTEIPLLRLLPPVPEPTTPPRPLRRRIATSQFAADVRRHAWLLGLLVAGIACVAITIATRGQFVTWDGLQDIPTGSTR